MRTNPTSRKHRALYVGAVTCAALIALGDLGAGTAEAVVGRPLTPMSYAGVARRTTRRAVAYGAVAPGAVYGGPTMMTALPAGCARTMLGAALRYQCGASLYAPQYNGPNVVYVPVR